MTKAIILNTIEDVKHCLKHELHKDAKLFSANANVVYYLRYKCGVECKDLCYSLEYQEFFDIQMQTLKISTILLKDLDRQISPILNNELGLNMRYFGPLYSLTAAKQLSIYLILKFCLNRMLTLYPLLNDIYVYDSKLGSFKSYLETFLSRVFPHRNFFIINYKSSDKLAQTTVSNININEIPEILSRYEDENLLADKLLKQQKPEDKNVVVLAPLNRLNAVIQKSNKANIYYFDAGMPPEERYYQLNHACLSDKTILTINALSQSDVDKVILSLLQEDVCRDFCQYIIAYLLRINPYIQFNDKRSIHSAYWELPQTQGSNALLLEYFMTNRSTQVVGVQAHETFLFGQILGAYPFESIFNRCQYFFTQGLTQEDMDILCPEASDKNIVISPQIISGNTFETAIININNRKTVDLTVYLQPTPSFLQTSYITTNIESQEALICFLDSQQNKEIHVVVHDYASPENCAMLSLLERSNNVTLFSGLEATNYLNHYKPQTILLDFPLPCMENMLSEDITIILMNQRITFGKNTITLLKERIYYTENFEETVELLKRQFKGTLDKKDDIHYVNKFCNQKGLAENILRHIDS